MVEEAVPTRQQVELLMAQVFALVQACPAGRVTTYSGLGRALGYPRGARMIGWIMNEVTDKVPAQRVISSKGELTGSWAFGSPDKMRQLLEAEGVVFLPTGNVDLKRYAWSPVEDLTEAERQLILGRASSISVSASDRLLYLLRNDPASPLRSNLPRA